MFERKLGFGLMRLPQVDPEDHSKLDLDTMARMVDIFLERGFSYFDTAYMYHGGMSEVAARETLVRRYPRDRFVLTDKMPIAVAEEKGEQERIFAEQLERCGVDYFDIYLIHNLGAETYPKALKFDTFDFVEKKRREGRARYTGISYHHTADLLDTILSDHPEVDFVQLQINYLDWDNEGIQSGKCYEVARKHGKQVIVMEPIKGGTLANVPKEAETLFRAHSPALSTPSWAVRYAASLEDVVMTLSGMSNLEQLLDNTSYMQDFKPLTEKERGIVAQAAKIIAEAAAIPCTACQYCINSCPRDIPIPKYFSLYNNRMQQTAQVPYYAQQAYYDNYTKTHGKASDCIACRACEQHCPQQLRVVEYLKDVVGMFESQ